MRYLNPAAARLLACSEAEAVGRPMEQVLHLFRADTRERVTPSVSHVLAGDSANARLEQPARCPLVVEVSEPLVGHWDPMRLEQVITNLLFNACKYGAHRPVEVRVTREDGYACLTVKDHGIGIAPEHHERIFQRFERAVSQRHYGGFGLGLWIVRQILESLRGDIRVHSQPGEGATFIVRLPLDPAASAVA